MCVRFTFPTGYLGAAANAHGKLSESIFYYKLLLAFSLGLPTCSQDTNVQQEAFFSCPCLQRTQNKKAKKNLNQLLFS